MQINEFEKRINQLLQKDEDTRLFEDELRFYVCADGCLSASLNGESIGTEDMPWSTALRAIIEFLEKHRGLSHGFDSVEVDFDRQRGSGA